jgi:hypothetical protein
VVVTTLHGGSPYLSRVAVDINGARGPTTLGGGTAQKIGETSVIPAIHVEVLSPFLLY